MKTVMKNRIHSATITAFMFLAATMGAQAQDASAANVVKVTTTLHGDGTRTVTKLDAEARTTESSKYSGDKLIQRSVFKLNDQNKPETGEIYDAKGKLLMKVKNVHDDMGRVSEETRYTSDDQFIVRLVYHYGTSGQVAKIDGYDASGNLLPSGPAKKDKRNR
jgi:hypothetical protein